MVSNASMMELLSLNFVANETVSGVVPIALQASSKVFWAFVRACLEYLRPNLKL